jgi:hypothetical protein
MTNVYCGFRQPLQANIGIVPQIIEAVLSFTFIFSVHCSLIIQLLHLYIVKRTLRSLI